MRNDEEEDVHDDDDDDGDDDEDEDSYLSQATGHSREWKHARSLCGLSWNTSVSCCPSNQVATAGLEQLGLTWGLQAS